MNKKLANTFRLVLALVAGISVSIFLTGCPEGGGGGGVPRQYMLIRYIQASACSQPRSTKLAELIQSRLRFAKPVAMRSR